MSLAESLRWDRFRPWLILGRVSNLPTVWSNCLAAWLLAGGGSTARFLLICLAGTFIYIGGMILNDVMDVRFDRRFRPERPIVSGAVGRGPAGWCAGLLLLVGGVIFGSLSTTAALFGTVLVFSVVVYDSLHKIISFAPVVMALCRFFLFMAAGAGAAFGVTGGVAWSALVLAGYIIGLSYVARGESTSGVLRWWYVPFLALPLVLAGFVNPPQHWLTAAVAGPVAIFTLWTVRAMSHLWRDPGSGGRQTVSGLLAGIVLVDLVAVMPSPFPWGIVFLALFVLALLLQRYVPPT